MIQASSVLHHQQEDLLLGHASDFQAFRAASFAAQNSNSRPGCFQKLRQEFHQRPVRAVLNRRRSQPPFYSSPHSPTISVLLPSRLHLTGKINLPSPPLHFNLRILNVPLVNSTASKRA